MSARRLALLPFPVDAPFSAGCAVLYCAGGDSPGPAACDCVNFARWAYHRAARGTTCHWRWPFRASGGPIRASGGHREWRHGAELLYYLRPGAEREVGLAADCSLIRRIQRERQGG